MADSRGGTNLWEQLLNLFSGSHKPEGGRATEPNAMVASLTAPGAWETCGLDSPEALVLSTYLSYHHKQEGR